MVSFVKNFGLEFCYFYCYVKMSKQIPILIKRIITIFVAIGLAIVASFLEKNVGVIRIPFMILSGFVYLHLQGHKSENDVAKALLSFSISYLFFIISVIITSVFTLGISYDFGKVYGQYFCTIVHILIIRVPFTIVRLKNGMSFLKNKLIAIQGVTISIAVIFLAMLASKRTYNHYYLLIYVAFFVLVILIFVYWRTSITRSYLERLGNRNIASLNEELLQKDEYIKKLEADVERLGKIIHRDNKLVPAMEMAVERFIMDESGEMSTGSELLEELRKMSKDRKGLVTASVNAAEPGVNTGVAKVDNLITYMSEKASTVGISLKVTQGIDVKEMLEKNIDEESFCTLLADLLDNAIIATKYNNARDVLLDMSMIKKAPAIHIFDSGISFDKEVLINYGIEQITTHGDDGGSGIGLMQTYEILAKCRASIFIDEFSSGLYTKKISVVFDRKRQFLLYTPREDSEVSFLKRRADLTVVRK